MRALIVATAFAAMLTSTAAIAQQSQPPMHGQQVPGVMPVHGTMDQGMMSPGMMGGMMGQGMPGYGMMGPNMMGPGMGGMMGQGMPGYGMMGPNMVGPGMMGGMMGQGMPGYGMMGPNMMGPGMMGQGMPGYGMSPNMMGPGMMGQGMGPGMTGMMMDPSQYVEGRIEYLKTALKITDAQAPQWNAYAEALRANAKRMGEMMTKMMSGGGMMGMMDGQMGSGLTALDRFNNAEQHITAHLEMLKALKGPTTELYKVLSDEQKRIADQFLTPMGMM